MQFQQSYVLIQEKYSETCFGDITSSDCPSSTFRRGKHLEHDEEDGEEEEIEGFTEENKLGPHPSVILKEIFTNSKPHMNAFRKKKKKPNKNKQNNRATTGVISALKTLISCMTDPTDSACTSTYRLAENKFIGLHK